MPERISVHGAEYKDALQALPEFRSHESGLIQVSGLA